MLLPDQQDDFMKQCDSAQKPIQRRDATTASTCKYQVYDRRSVFFGRVEASFLVVLYWF